MPAPLEEVIMRLHAADPEDLREQLAQLLLDRQRKAGVVDTRQRFLRILLGGTGK
jgi:hypothetical protein